MEANVILKNRAASMLLAEIQQNPHDLLSITYGSMN
jgi:hypothetical protein